MDSFSASEYELKRTAYRNFSVERELNLGKDVSHIRQKDAPLEEYMFGFVTLLFGCTHQHCTFPITSPSHGHLQDTVPDAGKTYIVCLDCGKEFPYDWQQMKIVRAARLVA